MHQIKACLLITLLTFGALRAAQELNVAVLDFEVTGVSKIEGKAITDYFRASLFRTKRFTIIERSELGKIIAEQSFQQTDCVDVSCAVEIGKMAAVDMMFLGAITRIGTRLIIEVRLIDVMQGTIELLENTECSECGVEHTPEMMAELADRIAGQVAVRGVITGINGPLAYTDLGTLHGMKKGLVLDAYDIEKVKDAAGKVLMKKQITTGKIRLVSVSPEASEGKILDGTLRPGLYVGLYGSGGSDGGWLKSPWTRYGLLGAGAAGLAGALVMYLQSESIYNNEYNAAATQADEAKHWKEIESLDRGATIFLSISGVLLVGGGLTFVF